MGISQITEGDLLHLHLPLGIEIQSLSKNKVFGKGKLKDWERVGILISHRF